MPFPAVERVVVVADPAVERVVADAAVEVVVAAAAVEEVVAGPAVEAEGGPLARILIREGELAALVVPGIAIDRVVALAARQRIRPVSAIDAVGGILRARRAGDHVGVAAAIELVDAAGTPVQKVLAEASVVGAPARQAGEGDAVPPGPALGFDEPAPARLERVVAIAAVKLIPCAVSRVVADTTRIDTGHRSTPV
jgi:hypothetical protein